jgi:hypothetical protein
MPRVSKPLAHPVWPEITNTFGTEVTNWQLILKIFSKHNGLQDLKNGLY